MTADADLPWYYGTASRTAAGDLGQRSTLGSKLEGKGASWGNVVAAIGIGGEGRVFKRGPDASDSGEPSAQVFDENTHFPTDPA